MTTVKYVGRHEIRANKCSPYWVSFIIFAGIMAFACLGSICFAEELPFPSDELKTPEQEVIMVKAPDVQAESKTIEDSEKENETPTENNGVESEEQKQGDEDKPGLCADEDSRYEGLVLTEKEKEMLAGIVWLESRGEPLAGQQAVAEVILNRIISPDHFADNLTDVLWHKNQFPTVAYLTSAEPEQEQYDVIEAAMNGPYVLPMSVFFFAKEPENENIWGTIGEHTFCYAWDWGTRPYK